MFSRKVHDLRHLGLGDLISIKAAFADPMVMDMQHNSCGGFVVLAEEAFEHVYDELHRRVVVVQNQHAVHVRPLGLRLGFRNNGCAGSALPMRSGLLDSWTPSRRRGISVSNMERAYGRGPSRDCR